MSFRSNRTRANNVNLVPYAVPFFVLLIALELFWGWHKGNNTYRINDTINSLALGVLSTSSKLVALNIGGRIFSGIEQFALPWQWSSDNVWSWIAALLLYDFCYYWFHRISHERQLFWASHVAHHQSEEFNLSTALRQTSTSFMLAWVFYVPCFLLGMPISLFVTIGSIHLIYQFWIHTEHIPKLGPFEWLFVSPSNHRVHHGQNAAYIDKNHGGLLIIWDRLFGTFKEEDEPVIYGVRRALHSWNPIWANLHIYWQMLQDAWRTESWRDKGYMLISPTGWRPADTEQRYPIEKSDLSNFHKYDAKPDTRSSWFLLAHFGLVVVMISGWEKLLPSLPFSFSVTYFGLLLFTLFIIGAALEQKPGILAWEAMRWIGVAAALIAGADALSTLTLAASWSYLLLSAVIMGAVIHRSNPVALPTEPCSISSADLQTQAE